MAGHVERRLTSDGCQLGGGQVCCRWPQGMEIARRPVFQREQEDLSLSKIMGLSSFKFLWWAPKDASFQQQPSAVQGHPIKGTNRKGVCDFLLVINSNFRSILHRFWDTATYWLKIANFPTAFSFNALARGEPFRICGWIFCPEN